jgi:MFS family permease
MSDTGAPLPAGAAPSTPSSDPARSAAVPLLRQHDFSSLWWGQLISILGERLTYLALVGLLAEHTGHFATRESSWLLSVLANVMLAPVLILAPFTGAWVDRSNLKRVLVTSDALRGILVVLIPFLYRAAEHTLPVFVIVFLLFTCNVFFLPAKSAITPEIVPRAQLLAANALLAVAGIIATALGALGGGWFVDHYGWDTALYVNGVTYLVSVVALMLIRYRHERHAAHASAITVRGYVGEVAEGWRLVRSNPVVGLALVALAAVWVGGGFLHVAGNQHVQRAASTPGMERVGILLAVLGLGSGLGTWWTNARAQGRSRALLLGIGLMLAGAGIAVFAVSSRFAVFAIAAFLIGVAAAPAFTLCETLLQQGTQPRQRGRVFSLRDFLMRLVFLIGVTLAGWTARSFGVQAALLLAAALMVATGAIAAAWRGVPRVIEGPADAAPDRAP